MIELAVSGRETNRVLLAVSVFLGILAAFTGAYHGYGEVLQGNAVPKGVVIYAYGGSGCVPEAPTYCFPAMTVIPGPFIVSGMLTVVVALIVLVATAMMVRGKWRGSPLLILSIILLLVGGGFFPPIFGVVASLVGQRASKRAATMHAKSLSARPVRAILKNSLTPYVESPPMGRLIRSNFHVAWNSSLKEWGDTARSHPVFEVRESTDSSFRLRGPYLGSVKKMNQVPDGLRNRGEIGWSTLR